MKTIENYRLVLPALLFVLSVAGLDQKVRAQVLSGFLSQQSEKEKLMEEQVVGYETYLATIRTGYHLSQKGLSAANTLKTGSFRLNAGYFGSLNRLSPAVQAEPKAKAIASVYRQIVAEFTEEIAWQEQQKLLTAGQLTYIRSVYSNLVQKARIDLNEMTQILRLGKLQMTDAQRLDQLAKLYAAMQDKQAFAAAFTAKCRQLALSRKSDGKDRATLKMLYGIQ